MDLLGYLVIEAHILTIRVFVCLNVAARCAHSLLFAFWWSLSHSLLEQMVCNLSLIEKVSLPARPFLKTSWGLPSPCDSSSTFQHLTRAHCCSIASARYVISPHHGHGFRLNDWIPEHGDRRRHRLERYPMGSKRFGQPPNSV